MASYFDLPPQHTAPPATVEELPEEQRNQLGRTNSLLSPAITQILAGLGDDHSDSSSDEEDRSVLLDEKEHATQDLTKEMGAQKIHQDKQRHNSAQAPRPSSLSPNRSHTKSSSKKASGQSKSPTPRANGDSSAKLANKQPHMARFHSLRSMLFQQRIEDQMKKVTQEDTQRDMSPAEKWRSQHEDRQMHHPTTPTKDAQAKSGLGSRLKMTIRRMTTKDASGMEKIREDGAPVQFKDRESTASSDKEEEQNVLKKEIEPDNESINESDVDELVRWVSRRDSSSNGEALKDTVKNAKEDSGHESLGPSDVDELVQFARRKSDAIGARRASNENSGDGDASTESDTEIPELSSDNEEDADDLVRWISHRDGQKAGPIQRNQEPGSDSDAREHCDSDIPELGRWVTRYDGTSGESGATTPVKATFNEQRVEDEEENRGRPRSREIPEPPVKEKTHLTNDDIDDLVRWVSRKDSKQKATGIEALESGKEKDNETEKKEALGMTLDQGSLSNSDVQDLIEHVRRRSRNMDENETPNDTDYFATTESSDLDTLGGGEITPIATAVPARDPAQELAAKREDLRKLEKEEREKELGMSMTDSSLSQGDTEELVKYVRKS